MEDKHAYKKDRHQRQQQQDWVKQEQLRFEPHFYGWREEQLKQEQLRQERLEQEQPLITTTVR